MQLRQDIPLAPLTTFRMGPSARYFIEIRDRNELPEAFGFIKEKQLPFFVLGGGSNTIFTAPDSFDGVVLKMEIPGYEVVHETETGATIRIGAGENWDSVVARSVEDGLSGIEALSSIPGSAGAAPIQNIGAYGQEVGNVTESVDVYDYVENAFKSLSKDDCQFSYRDSVFKHEKRYVVTGITLRLLKEPPAIPDYSDPKAYFEERGISHPTLKEVREAVVFIRKNKLPDPRDVASVGSFFKNPFVDAGFVERVHNEYARTVIFPTDDGRFKAGAGWMLEVLGFKGKDFGTLSLYEHHALVIVNNGGATYPELAALVTHLQDRVHEQFGVEIEPEPVFV